MADDLRPDPQVMAELERAGLLNTALYLERLARSVTANGASANRLTGLLEKVNDDGEITDRAVLPPATRAREYTFGTDPVITQADNADGVTVDISVTEHTRVGDGNTISYQAGSVAGLDPSTTYYVYYDDPEFAGGAVTYVATTTRADVTAVATRVYLGAVETGALGASSPGNDNTFDGYEPDFV